MSGKIIVQQHRFSCNGHKLQVTLTRQAFATDSRVILPAGSTGRVLHIDKSIAFIDFGLLQVIRIPVDSDLIAWPGGEK